MVEDTRLAVDLLRQRERANDRAPDRDRPGSGAGAGAATSP
jgi:hypothetical protein